MNEQQRAVRAIVELRPERKANMNRLSTSSTDLRIKKRMDDWQFKKELESIERRSIDPSE